LLAGKLRPMEITMPSLRLAVYQKENELRSLHNTFRVWELILADVLSGQKDLLINNINTLRAGN